MKPQAPPGWREWPYPVTLALVGVLVWWDARKLAPAPFDPLGPKTFPVWIAWGLIGLAVLMMARLALGHAAGQARHAMVIGLEGEGEHRRRIWVGLALFALSLAYAAALTWRGAPFLVATAVYVFAGVVLLGGTQRRNLARGAVVALLFAGVNDLLFRRLFALDLP